MRTPAQHLEEAEELLHFADENYGPSANYTGDIELAVKLATAHISLALAINAVPLVGDLKDELRDLRSEPLPYELRNIEGRS